MYNEYERLFNSDVREKKRTASGVYHRASRRGYIRGGVKTASDFLTTKQKKLLNGEVTVRNIYEDINKVPKIEEIKAMVADKSKHEEIVRLFSAIRPIHSNNALIRYWGISTGGFYTILEKIGMHTPKKNTKPRQSKNKAEKEKTTIFGTINDMPTMEELNRLNDKQKSAIISAGKAQFGNKLLKERYGLTQAGLYKLYKQLGVGLRVQDRNIDEVKKPVIEEPAVQEVFNEVVTPPISEDISNNQLSLIIKDNEELKKANEEMLKVIEGLNDKLESVIKQTQEKTNGFKINFNGTYGKAELEDRLVSIAGITVEDKKYKISIELEEV